MRVEIDSQLALILRLYDFTSWMYRDKRKKLRVWRKVAGRTGVPGKFLAVTEMPRHTRGFYRSTLLVTETEPRIWVLSGLCVSMSKWRPEWMRVEPPSGLITRGTMIITGENCVFWGEKEIERNCEVRGKWNVLLFHRAVTGVGVLSLFGSVQVDCILDQYYLS